MQLCPPDEPLDEDGSDLGIDIKYSLDCGVTWASLFEPPYNYVFQDHVVPDPCDADWTLPYILAGETCMSSPVAIGKVYDTPQGVVSTGAGSITDSAQDFTEWAVPGSPARYMVMMRDPPPLGGATYGYLGYCNAPWTASVFMDRDLTISGWNSVNGGSTEPYEIWPARHLLAAYLDPIPLDARLRLDVMGSWDLQIPMPYPESSYFQKYCPEICADCYLTVSLRITEV